MFVIVSTYRAKAGEEDAIIALHENWHDKCGLRARACLSWELLRKEEAPREFITIARFVSEEFAQAVVKDLEMDAWYDRLMSLIDEGSMNVGCSIEWRLSP